MRNVCENVSPPTTNLFCRFCWNDSACTRFPASNTQLFSQGLSSHTLCSCIEIFSTTNNLCNFWHRNFQQVIVLQLGRYIYAKMELKFSQYVVQVHRIPVHVVDQHLFRMESLLVLKQPSCNVFQVRKEYWKLFWTSKQEEWYQQLQWVFFHRSCHSSQCEYYEKNNWAAVWIAVC